MRKIFASILATGILMFHSGATVAGVAAAGAGGAVTTIAEVEGGSGGLAVDAAGRIYAADFGSMLGGGGIGGHRVFRVDLDGTIGIFAQGMRGASGNSFDSMGNLLQSSIGGGFISKITPSGEVSTLVSEGLQSPVGIAIDAGDTLFVANCGSGSIQKVTRAGQSSRFVASDLLKCPNGITFGDEGNLYVANFSSGDVVKITPAGDVSVLATLPGENNGHLTYVGGSLYVVGRSAHQIFKVSLAGKVEVFAGSGEKGGADGPALESSFCFPNDIVESHDGKALYVNDVADHASEGRKLGPTRVRRIALP